MKKSKTLSEAILQAAKDCAEKSQACLGRKRDPAIESQVLEAAINILAEKGYAGMTMDMVACRAKAGKASLYRRWPSKVELVRDALVRMSRDSVGAEELPDTGSLREDLLSLVKPHSEAHSERKLRVLAGLGTFYTEHGDILREVFEAIFGPWTAMNRALILRAIERGEISKTAPVDMVCDTIIAMASHQKIAQQKSFDREAYAALLDTVLLPALKA